MSSGLPGVEVAPLDADRVAAHLAELVALLRDAVDGGASVGFLPPLSAADAARYWAGVGAALREGSRVLLVATRMDQGVLGSVQLDLASRPNATHRAEVAKLMVLQRVRRQGMGRALMLAAQEEAQRRGRTTLVLDTRQGDPSERLYRSLGWEIAGTIPRYARSADGELHSTAMYYRLLDPPSVNDPATGQSARAGAPDWRTP